jgi:integrase
LAHTVVHTEEAMSKKPKRKPISFDVDVRAAEPGDTPVTGAISLFLRVRATKKGVLTRRWIVRVTSNGRRPKFGLGSYPTIGLARARQLAQDAHSDVAAGKELGQRAKRRQRAAEAARSLTLSQAIDGYLAGAPRPFKNAKSDRIRERALHIHFASLHAHDVAKIKVADVFGILRKLAPETAVKSHAAVRAVFDYAIVMLEPHGVRFNNPADKGLLRHLGWSPKSRSENKPHAAVDWRIIPSVVSELSRIDEPAAACVILMIATGMRAQTARLAKWDNIVIDPEGENSTWTPPLPDLKERHHKHAFIIPLNSIALDALKRPQTSPFVFGSLSESILNSFLHRLRRRHPDWRDPHTNEPFTFHGFRSALRTWVEDTRRDDSVLAELSLGHKVHGDVAARYIRTGLVEERRALLDAWSRHLRSESANVIQIHSTR